MPQTARDKKTHLQITIKRQQTITSYNKRHTRSISLGNMTTTIVANVIC